MARPSAIVSALKANPGRSFAPSTPGMSRISPALAEMMTPGGSYSAAYGQFLPRPSQVFTDGAFAPASPIYPTPVDQPDLSRRDARSPVVGIPGRLEPAHAPWY